MTSWPRVNPTFGDRWVNPNSGGLIGQREIETAASEHPSGLSRRQLFRVLYHHTDCDCLRWGSDVPATNVGSLHHFLDTHRVTALANKLGAIGVDVSGASNVHRPR